MSGSSAKAVAADLRRRAGSLRRTLSGTFAANLVVPTAVVALLLFEESAPRLDENWMFVCPTCGEGREHAIGARYEYPRCDNSKCPHHGRRMTYERRARRV